MTTLQEVKTQYTTVDGLKVAYRTFGKQSKYPLLYNNHLRGCMDTLDPALFNEIAKSRQVIIFDSFGVGFSEGEVPNTIQAMASIAAKFLAAINVTKADVIGFSMGGGVAQSLAMDYPHLVNKLVLAGTQSAIGDGVVLPPQEVLSGAGEDPVTKEGMFGLFFYESDSSQDLAEKWWKRIHERNVPGEERKYYVSGPGVSAMLTAIFTFTMDCRNFERLKDIKAPTLVTNGHTDIMSPTANSYVLQQEIKNAALIVYPDAGHGHLFQEPVLYVKHLDLFLDSP